jgi:hypothetical protein
MLPAFGRLHTKYKVQRVIRRVSKGACASCAFVQSCMRCVVDIWIARNSQFGLIETETVKMRYVLFRSKGDASASLRVGALAGEQVADISAYLASVGQPALSSMRLFLEMGAEANKAAASSAIAEPMFHVKLSDVDLRAPIYDWLVAVAGVARSRTWGYPTIRAFAARRCSVSA